MDLNDLDNLDENQIKHLVEIGKWATSSYLAIFFLKQGLEAGSFIHPDSDTILNSLNILIEGAHEATHLAAMMSLANLNLND